MLHLKCGFVGKTAWQFVTVPFLCSCRYGAAEPHAVAAFMGGKGDPAFARPHQPQPAGAEPLLA